VEPAVWRDLRAVWDRAALGHGGMALIAGGPGTGKTRMAHEFAAAVHRDGGAVLRARCAPDDAPLAVLRSAIERATADLGRLPPALAGLLGAGPAADEPEQLSQALAGYLVELAREHGGALLCLDDLHLADAASQAVLRRLAGRLADCPLVVLGTVPDEAAAGRWTDAPPVRLGPLDPAGVRRLVTSCVRGLRVDDELAQRLVARGGVTPFEVVEYIRAVADAGLLAPHWGSWSLDGVGLDAVETRAIDVPTPFRDFDDYWMPFLAGGAPAPNYALSLEAGRQHRLRERLRDTLPFNADGSIHLMARAWAVRGRA